MWPVMSAAVTMPLPVKICSKLRGNVRGHEWVWGQTERMHWVKSREIEACQHNFMQGVWVGDGGKGVGRDGVG